MPSPPRCASEQAVLVLKDAMEKAGTDTSQIIGASYGVKWLEADEEAPFGYVQALSAAAVKRRKRNKKRQKKDPKQYILPALSSLAYLSDGATPAVVLDQALQNDGKHLAPTLPSR